MGSKPFKSIRIILASVFACFVLAGCRKSDEAADSIEKTRVIYGTVRAEDTEQIIIDFQSYVQEVNVLEGACLSAGDTILTLDISDYEFSVRQKKYELEQDKIALEQTLNEQKASEEELKYIESELELKKGYLENSSSPEILSADNQVSDLANRLAVDKRNYDAYKSLYEAGAVSEMEFKTYEYTYQNSQLAYNNALIEAQNARTSLEQEVSSLEAQYSSAKAAVDNSEITVNAAIAIAQVSEEIENMESRLKKDYIEDNRIIAPRDGTVVTAINCAKGSLLTSEAGTAVELEYSDSYYIEGEVLEDMLSYVSTGDYVDIALAEEDDERVIVGRVDQLSANAVERDGDTVILARIEVVSGYEYLKPGLSADIYLNGDDVIRIRSELEETGAGETGSDVSIEGEQ